MVPTAQSIKGPLQIPGASIFPDGGQVFYVGSPVPAGAVPTWYTRGIFATVEAALGQCVSGRGDVIKILRGTALTIASADAWSALAATGVTIVGEGEGTERPTITWTTATSTLLMDVANFRIRNCQLFLAGPHVAGTALTVAAPITISAAGCEITDCDIWWGFDADQIVAIGITTTAAADGGKFNRNYCFAETAAVPTTTFLRLTGTDQFEMDGTMIIGPGSTTAIGPVQQLTTPSLKNKFSNSIIQNTLANSTISVTAIAGCTGTMDKCSLGVLASGNGITTGSGIQVTATYVAVAGAAGALATG
jgi:hypothetical protein